MRKTLAEKSKELLLKDVDQTIEETFTDIREKVRVALSKSVADLADDIRDTLQELITKGTLTNVEAAEFFREKFKSNLEFVEESLDVGKTIRYYENGYAKKNLIDFEPEEEEEWNP